MFEKLSIIIPAYNEERTLHLILDKVAAVQLTNGIQKEIILVNDCSTDDTDGAIKRYMSEHPELNIAYYSHEVNKGKGAALHTGISKATGDYTIIQDADLEYDPTDLTTLLEPIRQGNADAVVGTRWGDHYRIQGFWPRLHRMINGLLTICHFWRP